MEIKLFMIGMILQGNFSYDWRELRWRFEPLKYKGAINRLEKFGVTDTFFVFVCVVNI